MSRPSSKTRTRIQSIESGSVSERTDFLATEEPLEIRLVVGPEWRTVAVTMRTPGADFELATGFLHGEGVVARQDQIRQISYCTDPEVDAEQQFNIVNVELSLSGMPDLRALERYSFTSSSCGVCGKASLDALSLDGHEPIPFGLEVTSGVIGSLSDKLRDAQGIFESTGGLHAAALFSQEGDLQTVREDVGRHNAVDKLIGRALLEGRLPLSDAILMVSGRSSFEIMQKALAAGIPMVCAVSAPSSLAVELARAFDITLIGFLRGERFNVYSGSRRVRAARPDPAAASPAR